MCMTNKLTQHVKFPVAIIFIRHIILHSFFIKPKYCAYHFVNGIFKLLKKPGTFLAGETAVEKSSVSTGLSKY